MADNLRETLVHVSYLFLECFIVSHKFLIYMWSFRLFECIHATIITHCVGCVKRIISSSLETIGQFCELIVHLYHLIAQVLASSSSKVHFFQSQKGHDCTKKFLHKLIRLTVLRMKCI